MTNQKYNDQDRFQFSGGFFGASNDDSKFIIIDLENDEHFYEFEGYVAKILADLLNNELQLGEMKKQLDIPNVSNEQIDGDLNELLDYLLGEKFIVKV